MTARILAHPYSLGDVVLRAWYDGDGQPKALEILEAGPRVLIGGHFLRELHAGRQYDMMPFAEVDTPAVGGLLKIRHTAGILVYRITGYEPLLNGGRVPDAYVGEWPD